MGFYDEPDVQNPPPKKKFSPSTIWVPLVSAIIGGLVVLFLATFFDGKRNHSRAFQTTGTYYLATPKQPVTVSIPK